jgi:hypothetical protein
MEKWPESKANYMKQNNMKRIPLFVKDKLTITAAEGKIRKAAWP